MIRGVRPADQDVRDATEQILAGAEYARWRDRESEWFGESIESLARYLDWTAQLAIDSPFLYWLLLAGFTLVALAMLAHMVWSIRTALSVPAPTERRASVPATPRWADEAELLAAQGRYLEGAHRLVLGSIGVLVEQGVFELGRGDANRILRQRLHNSSLPSHLRARFLALLDVFEERWFRDRVEDDSLYRSWRKLHFELIASIKNSA